MVEQGHTFWLEDVATCASKHALIEHHSFVCLLPVERHDLRAGPPEHGRVQVRRRDAKARGVRPHQILFVVIEQVHSELFMVVEELVLR